MDSWYLHHPLLNLSRLALRGNEDARKLFLDSLEFAIKVAHHFNYQWPVFYDMETLEVIKAETAPGKGGEKDVAGSYAHIMLQAYELTRDNRYLQEAETAAQSLKGLGFDLFYQANNTAFGAGALLRLYKLTGKEEYLDLSYLTLANAFRNTRIWNCSYGYGKNFPSFFGLFPLNDAPYTAVYEEQELFCAFNDYLSNARDIDILPSLKLLMAEYTRYLIYRAVYYYPPSLPREMLAESPKIGEVDANLWIALEDIHDGWEQSGSVGQEVYGAGNAFGIVPRHYFKIPGEDFLVFVDYPVIEFKCQDNAAIIRIDGSEKFQCRLVIIMNGNTSPDFQLTDEKQNPVKGSKIDDKHFEYIVNGNSTLKLHWSK